MFRRTVAYWPSTEPSTKRCTCVNKRKNSETGASGRRYRNITLTCGRGWIQWWWQMHTQHRKQVNVRQLYNQVPQTAWGVAVPVGDRMPAEWEPAPDRGRAALSDPRLSSPAKMRKKCCYGQKNLGSICSSLSSSPTHLSHTTNINPFENKKWEVYFYHIYPTPPLEQDMTPGQFLSGV